MTELYELLINHASIWCPALASILGIGVTVICALSKVKASITEFKKEDVMTELTEQLKLQNDYNQQLVKTNKLLLDKYTKIREYADNKIKEEVKFDDQTVEDEQYN